jgi:hypothetical protein
VVLISTWNTRLSFRPENRRNFKRTISAGLRVEQLEDRCVPSTTVDLTTAGAAGMINGAIFRQFNEQPSGSGVLDSFVRIKAPGDSTIEQGYNTDARPLQFDENNSPVFTRSLQLASIPEVNIGGTNYREFVLDINQRSSSPLLSLDELRFFVGNTGDVTGYNTATNTLAGHTAVYDMGAGNWVELNARLSHGSGSSDMILYVPSARFAGGSYVYLYSKFGIHDDCNGGYEEWATGRSLVTATGSISGTVFNASANNTPYAGATVTLGQLSTVTNANGNYSFSNLAVGSGPFANFTNYTVAAIAPLGFTVTPAQTVALTLTSPNVTGVNFYLNAVQTFSIGGFVTDNGSPGTSYTVTLTDTTTHVTRTVTASASSSYSFTNLTAGHNYTVTLSSPGNMDTPTSYIINNLMNNVTNEDFLITPRT